MKRFNYTGTHKDDEAYMQKMCHEGMAAVRLVEGFWTFERCIPDQYTYRMAYVRGMSKEEIEQFKQECSEKEIEFVSKYSFWMIFRSVHFFDLYTDAEELKICEKIYGLMPAGTVVSFLFFILLSVLSFKVTCLLVIPAGLTAVYSLVCARCTYCYGHLLEELKRKITEGDQL